ncbi:unnamed protein product [Caenorhabditis bovis]|uniref:Hepatocyte growth factor-regulated tyrosine kinase substrate n=1 Tax=Caenorhabditis bovis TaxID=2654633 RepID=A0A8S1FAC1_9PELO|nr:unnamed protein product [Caenorhabditis bovis]
MSKKFDRFLEQATDSTLIEPNWDGIIACTDSIRSGEVSAKVALQSLRKRIQHENPHVVSHALLVLDACVKNCGHKMHLEISTREFMEDFKNLVTESKYDEVKNKALEMLQCWATAFANKPEYKMVVDTHNLMKLAGFDFPSLKEADAMFMAQVAPEWQDGNECYRCRTVFSMFTRKHHCRNCGQIFCDKCSSREMPLPQFGIDKEVRVCETCFETKVDELVKREKNIYHKEMNKLKYGKKPAGATSAEPSPEEKEKILREKEEEDLALAIAMSQSEAEAKEREKLSVFQFNGAEASTNDSLSSYHESSIGGYKGAAPSVPESPSEPVEDPLAKYLNRDYWQKKKEGKVDEWATSAANGGLGASAPPPSEPSLAPSVCSTLMAPDDSSLNADLAAMSIGNGIVSGTEESKKQADDTLKWCQSIKEQVSVMDNRIRSNLARGRPVFNDSAIQDLFTRLTELHSHVLSRMHTLDEQRSYYESLQDQLASIGEARQAINELREEHERKRQERMAEEQRLRQAQMQQTLEMMRMKKHAMLMEQREQALQRFQQQQQEMAMRRQQQQQYYANPQQVAYQPPTPQQYTPYQQPAATTAYAPQAQPYYPAAPVDQSQMYYQQAGQPAYPYQAPGPQAAPSQQPYYDYQAYQQQQKQQQQAYQQPQMHAQQPGYPPADNRQPYTPQQTHEIKMEAASNYSSPAPHQLHHSQQLPQQPHYGDVHQSVQPHEEAAEQPLISFD